MGYRYIRDSFPVSRFLIVGTESAGSTTLFSLLDLARTPKYTLWPRDEDPAIDEVAERGPFRTIAALAAARGRWPELRHGRFVPLWVDSKRGK